MTTQTVKTILMRLLGENLTAYIQAARFAWLVKKGHDVDPEMELLSRLLQPGETAVDVGANGANWTTAIHRQTGPDGHVFAFEADPYYAKATSRAAKLLGLKGVTLFPHGLSNSDEEVPLRIADGDGERLAGLGRVDKSAETGDQGVAMVRLRRLDSMVGEIPELEATALIKCDVEGYELFVFQGAAGILGKAGPAVILEVGAFEKQGYAGQDVKDFFSGLGYEAYALAKSGKLVPVDGNLDHPDAVSVNRVLLTAERKELLGGLLC